LIGQEAMAAHGGPDSAEGGLQLAARTLARHGYEPRDDDGRVALVNCPFHRLAQAHTELVCGMNHALVGGVTNALQPHCPTADLEPGSDRCCVVLRARIE
jgi:predicted ArsR family transcriptional regulator